MEALCRMATPALRKKLADQWFTLGHVATAFSQITDSEFETVNDISTKIEFCKLFCLLHVTLDAQQ